MFNLIHHIAIIGSDYKKSKHFYVDLLGFNVIRRIIAGSAMTTKLIWPVENRK